MEPCRTCISYSPVVQNLLHFCGRVIDGQGPGWDLGDLDSSSGPVTGPLNKLGQIIAFPICKKVIMLSAL